MARALTPRISSGCQLVSELPFLFFDRSRRVNRSWTIMGKSIELPPKLFIRSSFRFSSSSYHHSHTQLEIRQKNLQLQYKFDCQCLPCQKNYPLFVDLPTAAIPTLITQKDIDQIMNLNKKYAAENFGRLCKYLTDYGDHYPCNQISSVEESLKMCLHLLVGNVPLKAQHQH